MNKFVLSVISSSILFSLSAICLPNQRFLSNRFSLDELRFSFDDSTDCSEKDEIPNLTRSSQNNTFKYYYFNNMIANFGNNDVGSCGYVAMAMLLTYFDTYWDDSIVPTNYEVSASLPSLDASLCASSPGTLREATCPDSYRPFYDSSLDGESGVPNNYSLYKNWLYSNYYNYSLHTKLIIDHLGVNTPYGLGVGPSTFNAVFSEYFSSINYSNYIYIRTPDGATSDQVKSWVIDQIVNFDRPVILGRPGHVTIAYDYDSSTDKVYVHNGWLAHSHDEFNYQFDDAHTLVFNGQHNHSNNYTYQNQSYCQCQLTSHYHRCGYNMESDTQHRWECYCGAYGYESHSFVPVSPFPLIVLECEKCGERKVLGGF